VITEEALQRLFFSAVKQIVKGIEAMAHSVTLLTAENRNLQKSNEALSKSRRAKKTRVRQGGVLTIEDAQDILARKDAEEQVARDKRENRDSHGERQATGRRCGNCGELGHTARTCQVEAEISDV
jgi:hypothetical protein